MKRNLILPAFLVCALAVASFAQGRRIANPITNPTLSDAAKNALITALSGPDGEYAARAEYETILLKFGSALLPYAHIIQAEENHIAALQQQCNFFGVPVPEDDYKGNIEAPADKHGAAQSGILAEEANVKMYELLLKDVQNYPSLVRVFTRLQSASLNCHLPALKAAEANGGAVTAGTCNQAGCLGPQAGAGCLKSGGTCPQQSGTCRQMGPGCRQMGSGCQQQIRAGGPR
jgi:hypothetical protein